MKQPLSSIFTFSRTERWGIIALLSILLLLVAIRASMPYWAGPTISPAQQQRLIHTYQQTHHSADSTTDSVARQ